MRFLFIILLICKISTSQNLVPNPSFETYTMCPNNTGQISNATGWIASISSPDYFNSCATNTNVSVPKNFFLGNYQQAKNGNAYAGIGTYVSNNPNFRENLSVQLISSLINTNYYFVKFYVANVQLYPSAHNNIALNFSSVLTTTVSFGGVVNLPMHVYKFGNPIIADTLNWTEIMGIYKANGTEQYITIGNFKDDASTNINYTKFGNTPPYAAYYMIDDVSVEPICTPFWSYRDTTVAIGDSVLIGPAITGLNINWYDATSTLITNAPGIYVKPAQTTTYTAVEDFCGNTYTNTIVVTVTPTAVKEYENNALQINLHPNPANDIVTITSKNDFSKIELLNVTGQVLLSETVNDKTRQINLNGFSEGIYFVKVVYANGMSVTKKVVKQ